MHQIRQLSVTPVRQQTVPSTISCHYAKLQTNFMPEILQVLYMEYTLVLYVNNFSDC